MGLKDSLEVSKNAINNSKINTSHNKKINNINNNIVNDYNHNYYDNSNIINSGVNQDRNNQNMNINNFNNIDTNKNNKKSFDILGNNEEEKSLDMFTKVNTIPNMSKQNYDINVSEEKKDIINDSFSNITDNNEMPKIVIRPKGSK